MIDRKFLFNRANNLRVGANLKKTNTVAYNFGAFDSRLTPASRILFFIMANILDNDVEYHFSNLTSRTGLNYSDLVRGTKELEKYGYLEIEKPRFEEEHYCSKYAYMFYYLPKDFSLEICPKWLIEAYPDFLKVEYPAMCKWLAKEHELRVLLEEEL